MPKPRQTRVGGMSVKPVERLRQGEHVVKKRSGILSLAEISKAVPNPIALNHLIGVLREEPKISLAMLRVRLMQKGYHFSGTNQQLSGVKFGIIQHHGIIFPENKAIRTSEDFTRNQKLIMRTIEEHGRSFVDQLKKDIEKNIEKSFAQIWKEHGYEKSSPVHFDTFSALCIAITSENKISRQTRIALSRQGVNKQSVLGHFELQKIIENGARQGWSNQQILDSINSSLPLLARQGMAVNGIRIPESFQLTKTAKEFVGFSKFVDEVRDKHGIPKPGKINSTGEKSAPRNILTADLDKLGNELVERPDVQALAAKFLEISGPSSFINVLNSHGIKHFSGKQVSRITSANVFRYFQRKAKEGK
ncbi:MAG: hypothetical protein Q7K42_03245 [Candidatus Diapherotrites archaeon]|nr:hypothetical protein [Candidatus Diapherotrites archaeon]